jgi:hypothetical protein
MCTIFGGPCFVSRLVVVHFTVELIFNSIMAQDNSMLGKYRYVLYDTTKSTVL